ncbi:hypothetical protein FE257_001928 [Aspergillus nanangensis]|uniref:Major facilitator superfamily (MFS) profile domain-containing protein n=1 Tax=Aspergillus nanangensis TaxID=2582783 RepID=A0AAD4CEF2_ASPNN|nr:hypothetical protein FE257_001928 [Aspergillus nanangensis]
MDAFQTRPVKLATNGRRPVILACLLAILLSSIGLATQIQYAALLVLRCVQGFASRGLILIAGASTTDIITRAERGRYMFYSTLGVSLGEALGPTLGGVLTQFMGWRSIFWFLTILSGVIILTQLLFLRETCRAVVGDGGLEPQSWNKCALQLARPLKHTPDPDTRIKFRRQPGILATLALLRDRHVAILVLGNATCVGAWSSIISSLTSLLERNYKLDPLHIGLCYIPFALGALTTRWTAGTAADRLFRRYARQIGEEVQPNRQSPHLLRRISVERARLALGLPFLYFYSLCIIAYGWSMSYNVHLAVPLVLLFFFGNASTGMNNMLIMLAVDLNGSRPASTRAAMNFVTMLTGAGAVAGVMPLTDAIGFGWVGVLMAGLLAIVSLPLWSLYFWGQRWRQDQVPELD